jgi:hypothetical protein
VAQKTYKVGSCVRVQLYSGRVVEAEVTAILSASTQLQDDSECALLTQERRPIMSLAKVIAECGFELRQEPTKVVLVDLTGREREATAPEVNLWADVCQKLLKGAKCDTQPC